MKLQDLAQPQQSKQTAKVFESYFGNSVHPMYSDAHFVIPSDKIVNAIINKYFITISF